MTTLKDAFEDLFENRDVPFDESADRHFGPDFRQRTNGQWLDRATFLAGVAHLRDNVERITVTVLDEVIDGHQYAERHLVGLLDAHGQHVVQEVYLFADLDSDGRFARIEEVTLSLTSTNPTVNRATRTSRGRPADQGSGVPQRPPLADL